MNNRASLRAITRRHFGIRYRSAACCVLAPNPFSGSGDSMTAIITLAPVYRRAGTTLYISFSGEILDSITLSWLELDYALLYNLYRSTSADGPFVLIATTSDLIYLDIPPASGTYFYKVTGIESRYGETEASNILAGDYLGADEDWNSDSAPSEDWGSSSDPVSEAEDWN